ncbi:DNA polymerase IV [Ensifer sesbaniae]|uniref:DinB/UmuC family translesion DNA polymerase n=1 Tax=Ensifer sesbaniae TaxID=1214071 RepID=UPI001569FA10
MKWGDFTQVTRSKAVTFPIASAGELADVSTLLLSPLFPVAKGIRLLGVLLSSLDSATIEDKHQLALTL